MKISMIALTAVCFMSASFSSMAGTRDPGVNARQHIQSHRIINGVVSGELTKGETVKLYRQQKRINKLERAYKSDGQLTWKERKNLHRAQNRASKNIYRKKHNLRSR